jgi:hypothetical protein
MDGGHCGSRNCRASRQQQQPPKRSASMLRSRQPESPTTGPTSGRCSHDTLYECGSVVLFADLVAELVDAQALRPQACGIESEIMQLVGVRSRLRRCDNPIKYPVHDRPGNHGYGDLFHGAGLPQACRFESCRGQQVLRPSGAGGRRPAAVSRSSTARRAVRGMATIHQPAELQDDRELGWPLAAVLYSLPNSRKRLLCQQQ